MKDNEKRDRENAEEEVKTVRVIDEIKKKPKKILIYI